MELILGIMFGPALVFFLVALSNMKAKNKKRAKLFFILTGVYLVISLGTCGIMMANFKLY